MEEKIEETKVEETKEELPTEAPKEEIKEKEQPQPVDSLLPGPQPIAKYDDERKYETIIEEKRLAFTAKYGKSRRISYIMMAVVMAVAVGSVICLTQKNPALNIVGWVLISSAVVGMLIFYIVNRNRMPYMTKDYIKSVNELMNSYNYTHQDVTEAATDEKEKMDLADVIVDGAYKELTNIASRNVIHARYKNKKFLVSDLGLYTGNGKNSKSVFVGKYISTENTLHFKEHFVINIKNKDNPVDLPTNVEDLALLVDEPDFAIYGPKDEDIKKVAGTKFLPAIRKLVLDEVLLNAVIVIWAGHSAAYLSYCDDIMTLPFQNVFDGKANDVFKDNLYDLLEAFDLLNK